MRAHFATDDEIGSDDDKIEQQPEPLDERIDNFKKDTENMAVLTEFIDDVLQKAEAEASNQQNAKNDKSSQQPKEKSRQSFAIPDFKNGKVVNRARGFVVRIFDAICNCANTAAGPAQRIGKLRGKRRASSQPATNAATDEKQQPPTKEKAKKQENGKEKLIETKLVKAVTVDEVELKPVVAIEEVK